MSHRDFLDLLRELLDTIREFLYAIYGVDITTEVDDAIQDTVEAIQPEESPSETLEWFVVIVVALMVVFAVVVWLTS